MEKKVSNPSLMLIILCVAIYAVSHIGRKAYDSNINEIMDFYGQEKSIVGLVGTFFFVSYAIGQVVHGLMCKYYNPKIIIGVALFVTSLMNFLVGIMPVWGFKYIKYIWLINGFAYATFWPVTVLVMTKIVASKYKRKAMVSLLIPVPLGTFLSYGISALMSYLNSFKYTFYLSSLLLLILGIIWSLRANVLFKACDEQKKLLNEQIISKPQPQENNLIKSKTKVPKSFILMFSLLALLAVINNLVKDGINTWTPTLLKEKYNLENWLSVLLTLFLPMFAMFGSFFAVALNKRTKNYSASCGILYLLATAVFVILILCLNLDAWIITLISFILVILFMSSINNVVTCIFPMENGDVANPGMVAGFIDGFCYVGSAIASFGLGKIAEVFGSWNVVMYCLLGLCAIATVLCFLSMFIQKKQKS